MNRMQAAWGVLTGRLVAAPPPQVMMSAPPPNACALGVERLSAEIVKAAVTLSDACDESEVASNLQSPWIDQNSDQRAYSADPVIAEQFAEELTNSIRARALTRARQDRARAAMAEALVAYRDAKTKVAGR